MNKTGSLTIVGCGIKFMSHLTIEAKAFIESANIVLYLVNEPAMREWLLKIQPSATSLDNAYTQYSLRQDAYKDITRTILNVLTKQQHVCVVLEGHPTFFAQSALAAAKQAKAIGYKVMILPGISAEDYLFAELQIDPGSVGCQSYEATDLLIHRRALDGCSHVILWQVGVIGLLKHRPIHHHQKGTKILVDYLSSYYSHHHEVFLFEGSQYPHIASTIKSTQLLNLPEANISRITSLYIPPARKAICDLEMLKKLDLSLGNIGSIE